MINKKIAHTVSSPYIPEIQKDRDWHKSFHARFVSAGSYDVAKSSRVLKAFSQYLGEFDPLMEYSTLTVGTNNLMLPIDAINYNAIMPILQRRNGQFVKRGYGFSVEALAPSAISRKELAKMTMQVDFDLLPLAAKSQEMTGLAFISKDSPKSELELDKAKSDYKDMHEIVTQRMLNDFVTRHTWEMKRLMIFQDVSIAGDGHFMMEYVDGELVPTLLKPSEVFYDTTARDPLLSDAQFYVIARYMALPEVLSRWKLSEEDVKTLETCESSSVSLGAMAGDLTFPTVRHQGSVRHVLVTEVYWRDVKVMDASWSRDKFDKTHYSLSDKHYTGKPRKKPEGSIEIPVQQIRHCTAIASSIYPEDGYGLIDWVPRSYSGNWPLAPFPIVSLVPSLTHGVQKSLVELLAPLQGMRDRCMYMIARAMKKDHGKGVAYDVSQRPDGYESSDLMYYFDTLGLLEIQSRQFGGHSNYNQFQSLDLSISPSVTVYIQLMQLARDEMQRIAGVNDPMMGDMSVSGQTVGVTKQAIGQGHEFNSTVFMMFDLFTKRVLEIAAAILRRCVVENPEKYRSIIGDDGVKFYKDFPDADLEDHGVHIFVDDRFTTDAQVLGQMTTFAVQNGFMDAVDGIKVLNARDLKEQESLFREITNKAQAAKAEAQQQQQQAQQQQTQQLSQLKIMETQDAQRRHMETLNTQMQIAQNRTAASIKAAELKAQAQVNAAVLRERSSSQGNNRPYLDR